MLVTSKNAHRAIREAGEASKRIASQMKRHIAKLDAAVTAANAGGGAADVAAAWAAYPGTQAIVDAVRAFPS